MKPFLVLLLCLIPAGLVLGQGYTTSANTKLNYREVTRGRVEITTPQGSIPVHTYHNAVIDIRFAGNDTARASYDSLTISLKTSQGEKTPETNPVIGKPFVLYFPSNGRVKTVKTPEFPQSFQGVSDLHWEFWDFFLRLPGKSLRNGLTWTDSLQSDKDEPQVMNKTGRYEVTGDTIVDGLQAKVIKATITYRVETSGKGPGPGITVKSTLSGIEYNTFYFAAKKGVLVGRKRSGSLEGNLKYEGGPQPVDLPEHMKYQSTISLIRK